MEVSSLTSQLSSLQQNMSVQITSLQQNISVLENQIIALNHSVRFSSYDNVARTFHNGNWGTAYYVNVAYDTHQAYDTISGIYTIPINGTYHIEAQLSPSINPSDNYQAEFVIFVNSACTGSGYYVNSIYNGVTSSQGMYATTFFVSADIALNQGDAVLICLYWSSSGDVIEYDVDSYNSLHIFNIGN